MSPFNPTATLRGALKVAALPTPFEDPLEKPLAPPPPASVDTEALKMVIARIRWLPESATNTMLNLSVAMPRGLTKVAILPLPSRRLPSAVLLPPASVVTVPVAMTIARMRLFDVSAT
jgi:hypothetical protein